jgi:hypothetical protein
MIDRSVKLNKGLVDGRSKTKSDFDNLRRSNNNNPDAMEGGLGSLSSPQAAGCAGYGEWQAVADGDSMCDAVGASPRIDELWRNIERKHYDIMLKRYAVNNSFANENTFENHWKNCCKVYFHRAGFFFYMGTFSMMIGVGLWAWAQFRLKYASKNAAITCILPVLLTIPIGIYVKFQMNRQQVIAAGWATDKEQEDEAYKILLQNTDPFFSPVAEEGDETMSQTGTISGTPTASMKSSLSVGGARGNTRIGTRRGLGSPTVSFGKIQGESSRSGYSSSDYYGSYRSSAGSSDYTSPKMSATNTQSTLNSDLYESTRSSSARSTLDTERNAEDILTARDSGSALELSSDVYESKQNDNSGSGSGRLHSRANDFNLNINVNEV